MRVSSSSKGAVRTSATGTFWYGGSLVVGRRVGQAMSETGTTSGRGRHAAGWAVARGRTSTSRRPRRPSSTASWGTCAKGYPELAGMSPGGLRDHLAPLRELLPKAFASTPRSSRSCSW